MEMTDMTWFSPALARARRQLKNKREKEQDAWGKRPVLIFYAFSYFLHVPEIRQ